MFYEIFLNSYESRKIQAQFKSEELEFQAQILSILGSPVDIWNIQTLSTFYMINSKLLAHYLHDYAAGPRAVVKIYYYNLLPGA